MMNSVWIKNNFQERKRKAHESIKKQRDRRTDENLDWMESKKKV